MIDLELISKFRNLYCIHTILDSTENEIKELILSTLPISIGEKIYTICTEFDGDNFLVLTITVSNNDTDEVCAGLRKVYPSFEWEPVKGTNFTDICLRLDDDVIASLPQFLYDQ